MTYLLVPQDFASFQLYTATESDKLRKMHLSNTDAPLAVPQDIESNLTQYTAEIGILARLVPHYEKPKAPTTSHPSPDDQASTHNPA
jgi:hypothetical protein